MEFYYSLLRYIMIFYINIYFLNGYICTSRYELLTTCLDLGDFFLLHNIRVIISQLLLRVAEISLQHFGAGCLSCGSCFHLSLLILYHSTLFPIYTLLLITLLENEEIKERKNNCIFSLWNFLVPRQMAKSTLPGLRLSNFFVIIKIFNGRRDVTYHT